MKRIDTEGFPKVMKAWGDDENHASKIEILGRLQLSEGIRFLGMDYRDILRVYKHVKEIDPLEGLKVGDVIVKGENRRKVLGICGEVVFISKIGAFHHSDNNIYTIFEVKNLGYSIEG
jgi:hypothetical protein